MPKTKSPARAAAVRIRLSPVERKAFETAAEFAGIPISAWCRMVLRRVAVIDLRAVGKDAGL